MIAKVARLTQRLTGSLLGSVGVAMLVGNILICLSLIMFGFDVTLLHLPTQA